MMPLGHIGIPLLAPLISGDSNIDIRLLFIGALLPDMIDKPIGHLLLPENNGRVFAHTLMFSFSLLVMALFFRRLLPLSLGVSFHQILDGMFLDHNSALWPLAGPFRDYHFEIGQWFDAYLEPYVLVEEAVGLLIILLLIRKAGLWDRTRLRDLLTGGRVHLQQNHLYKKHMK